MIARLLLPTLVAALLLPLSADATSKAKKPAAKSAASAPAESHPGAAAFAADVAKAAQAKGVSLDEKSVLAVLAKAQYQQTIIDAISRPAESKSWKEYRPIFMNPKRIDAGIAYARENAEALARASDASGVPASIIVAILGVETNYGALTGKYKVIDALATLGFHYPPRGEFFRGELKQLFLLPPERLPGALDSLTGSYAGAMGQGQFMPTSFAKWAVDGDGDGRIDLWTDKADIYASVANYFVDHGWTRDQPIALPATRADSARDIAPDTSEVKYPLQQLAEWGYSTDAKLDPNLLATLLVLDGAEGREYWITTGNFYTITRYNRSPLYSLAVTQLAAAIEAGRAAPLR
jgi:membrane-bound lytic murein transglycosylase B